MDDEIYGPEQYPIEPGGLGGNSAVVNGVYMTFMIRGSLDVRKAVGLPPVEGFTARTHQEMVRDDTRRALEENEALQRVLEEQFPGKPFEAVFNQPSYDTAGPVGFFAGIVALVTPGTPLGSLAAFVSFADATVDVLEWLDHVGADIDRVDDGIAFLSAWSVLGSEHPDLTLTFVNVIRPASFEWEWELDGYLVGFRDATHAYVVPVAPDGKAGLPTSVPLDLFRERADLREQKLAAELAELEATADGRL